MSEMTKGSLELLTHKNSVLLLVDYQPSMIRSIASGDKVAIKKATLCAAKAASILGIPVVLSSINPKQNGEFFPEISELFPKQEVHARPVPSFDAFEDPATWNDFVKSGRKKLVLSGLWTSMCFGFTALHALREGYEVYGLIDAAGDSTPEAHEFEVKRMIQAGVVPITTETLVSEWMHDWTNPKAGELVKEVYTKFGAMIGLR